MTAPVRPATRADVEALARIWHDGWHDTHARLMPAEYVRVRTLDSFRDRLLASLPETCVTEVHGAPTGFCILKGDELYQLYVSAAARGTGVAYQPDAAPGMAPGQVWRYEKRLASSA